MRLLARLALCAALSLSPLTSARAADLSGMVADYLLGRVPPLGQETDAARGIQTRTWLSPPHLGLMATYFYFYKLGPDYWTFLILNPSAPLPDYLGTTQLTVLSRQQDGSSSETISRVNGGRFAGYLVQERTMPKGTRSLALFPPGMADRFSNNNPAPKSGTP